MKGNEKLAIYLGTFIFVIVGYLVSYILSGILDDMNIVLLPSIALAIGWFVICWLTYIGSTRWLETGEKVGILSLLFFILWLISTLATVVAFIAITLLEGNAALIDLDLLIDQFIFWMPYALGPAIAALLGVSNKSSR